MAGLGIQNGAPESLTRRFKPFDIGLDIFER